MEVLHSYVNGNTEVVLYQDGSKERTFSGAPRPVHPESLDVKITDYCDAGCSYCHEQSTRAGVHGDLAELLRVLSVLPAGVEIAIGGGNPLSHPDLIPFLRSLKFLGLVANITINQKHLGRFKDKILGLIWDGLVNGVGISYSSRAYLPDVLPILKASDNVVFHVIMGINNVNDIEELHTFCQEENRPCKILILGYKEYGFGLNFYLKNQTVEANKYRWFTQLAKNFKKEKLVLSFDNLAIAQLKLRRYFTDNAWSKFYMGDDGIFTMYVDGVKQQFARSSTAVNRTGFQQNSLLEFFSTLPRPT